MPARTPPASQTPPPAISPRPAPALDPAPAPAAPRGRIDDPSVPAVTDPTEGAAASASKKSAEAGGALASVPKSVAHLACAIAKPAYPALSRRMRETGTVLIELVVAATGRVESARIAETSGHERLDEAAREAVAAKPACRQAGPRRPKLRASDRVGDGREHLAHIRAKETDAADDYNRDERGD